MRLSNRWFDLASRRSKAMVVGILTLATIVFSNLIYALSLSLIFVETVPLRGPALPMLISVVTALIAIPIFWGFIIVIGRNLALQRHLKDVIRRDHLTRILSREAFLRDYSALAERAPDAFPGSLLVIDVDHFKIINDTCGHEAGDKALIAIAQALSSRLRPKDFVGRIGGEEFAAFLAGADAERTHRVAERLRRVVTEVRLDAPDAALGLSISIGAVHLSRPRTFKTAFAAADRLLYAAKRAGRNRVMFEVLDTGGNAAQGRMRSGDVSSGFVQGIVPNG